MHRPIYKFYNYPSLLAPPGCKPATSQSRTLPGNANPVTCFLVTYHCANHLKVEKKLNYCWDSSRYDKISDSGRSANQNRNSEYDLRKFYSLADLSIGLRGLYPVILRQLTSEHAAQSCFESRLDKERLTKLITSDQCYL